MTDLEMFADAMVQAHKTGIPASVPVLELTASDALAVQAKVMKTLGPVAGFKVGQGSEGAPILAPIPQRYVVVHGGTRHVQERMGVELEIGFRVLQAPPDASLPDRPERYFQPCVALELVEPRLAGDAAADPMMKFADLQINAGLVTGRDLADWEGSDFGTVNATLTAGDTVVIDGAAKVPGGSALGNLGTLITHLGSHCGGLQPGQVVITGSLCGLPWFGPGTTVTGQIEGLGEACVNLV